MKRHLVVIAPSNMRNNINTTLRAFGCEIISDKEMGDETASDIRLVTLFSNIAEQDQILETRMVTLDDVTKLTAYEAWRLFGGDLKRVGGGEHSRKRCTGTKFKTICRTMAIMGLRFVDLDPALFSAYEFKGWEEHGVTGRLAGLLKYVEVYDPGILMFITDDDIAMFHNCAEQLSKQVKALRAKLLEESDF